MDMGQLAGHNLGTGGRAQWLCALKRNYFGQRISGMSGPTTQTAYEDECRGKDKESGIREGESVGADRSLIDDESAFVAASIHVYYRFTSTKHNHSPQTRKFSVYSTQHHAWCDLPEWKRG